MHAFESIEQAQLLAIQWLWWYNDAWLNSAICGVPPRWLLDKMALSLGKIPIKNGGITHRIDCTIERAQLLLIKGFSGSGKTSLMAEIVMAVSGSHKLGVSPQSPTIIDGTVEENLDYFCDTEGLESYLTKLVKTSAVYCDLLEEFPKRENSNLRVGGTNISGGKIKRLSIVRCLLSQHAIQVFDEPDSGLNCDATSKIHDLIRLLKKNFIFVVISHSKNFDELADETIDFDEIVSLDRDAE